MNKARKIMAHQNYAAFAKEFSEDATAIECLAKLPEWDDEDASKFYGIMIHYDAALRLYKPGHKRMIVEGKEVEVDTLYLGKA